MFTEVNSHINFPQEEQSILAFWGRNNIFSKSLAQRQASKDYVFYDGPPFATGLPHYGHLLASTIKDVIPRYQTMCGYHVDRVFGWDCHGLPVENEMQNELGIKSKSEIESYGIARFNEACRQIVLRYSAEWETVITRIGRWVDFKNGYRSMDKNYMESTWWVFKQLWDKGLIYEGTKVMPYCPKDATPLSNFEVNMGYRDVDDPSIMVRFKLENNTDTYLLVWTTTPWTLPSNLALAVGPYIDYQLIKGYGRDKNASYWLAAERVSSYYFDSSPRICKTVKGKELINQRYIPLFSYFSDTAKQGAFRIIGADFVSTENGSGIVHLAPGFGVDDAEACKAYGIPSICPIDTDCCYSDEIHDYKGRFVKDCNEDIIRYLKSEEKLMQKNSHRHSYPHCWRCDTALIYREISTWFVKVEAIKEKLIEVNDTINWMPSYIKQGRFGQWLENAHDWAISRNRFWGCPLPIWRSEDGQESICLDSIKELEERSGQSIDDIHKHFVDEIVLYSEDGTAMRRVPEVLDCWFESGVMPYAQHHYPFEKQDSLERYFPADFIAEGLDQTRGWFYTLLVLSTALFEKTAFKNVIVNGLILAEDGRKMSKRLKNYPAPETIMDRYGADALRLCMLSSTVVKAESLRFSERAVKESSRTVLLPLWNVYSFFITYARIDHWQPKDDTDALSEELMVPKNFLDQWILSRLEYLIHRVRKAMESYDLQAATTPFNQFIDELTNWYIRRSRRRFWKSQNDTDKMDAYLTLYTVLLTFCKAAAPFMPFICEMIYQNLRMQAMTESVHLCDYPDFQGQLHCPELDRKVAHTRVAVSLGHYLRTQASIRTRQPLSQATFISMNPEIRRDLDEFSSIIADELNVKTITIKEDETGVVTFHAKANFKRLGKRLGKYMKKVATKISCLTNEEVYSLQQGDTISLTLENDYCIEISIDDIILGREEKSGMSIANEGEISIALDLDISAALRQEGWAREIIHAIQSMRKEENFNVTDRIDVTYTAPAPLIQTIEAFYDYICREVLAVNLNLESKTDAHRRILQIDKHFCSFVLSKHEDSS